MSDEKKTTEEFKKPPIEETKRTFENEGHKGSEEFKKYHAEGRRGFKLTWEAEHFEGNQEAEEDKKEGLKMKMDFDGNMDDFVTCLIEMMNQKESPLGKSFHKAMLHWAMGR